MKIPVLEICRAILWILDTARNNDVDKKIHPYEIQQKTGINHNTIKTFVKRHDGKEIRITWTATNTKKMLYFEISDGFEEYLRSTIVPYKIG